MIALIVKATVILAAAFCASAALRNRSAALRHAVWTAALAALLLLPAAGLLTPRWNPVAPLPGLAPAATTVVAAVAAQIPAAPSRPIPWLPILYAAGVLAAAFRFVAGAFHVSRIARRGRALDLDADYGLRVIASPETPMPLAWGFFRPLILVPAAALEWPAERLRAVLLHESMHHRRRDLLTQAIAQAACCLYWFHPLAWLALARQRRERELACDDAVLRHGVAPHDYAASLVDVVRSIASSRRLGHAPAMADAGGLEARVRAVLDTAVDRRPVSARSAVAIATVAAALLAPLAVVSLRAQTSGGATIAGVVRDPSGAVIPFCQISAKNLDGSNQEIARANAAGEYRLAGIPAGRYALEFASGGFALRKAEVAVVNGAVARYDANLEVGQVRESLAVTAPRLGPSPRPQSTAAPQRIRVGGNVVPCKLIRQTRPVYPPALQQAGAEGTVVMRAIISKEGAVLSPQVINSVDPLFAKAALDAVSQWLYQPALLNGEPIETLTTVSVEFQLAQ